MDLHTMARELTALRAEVRIEARGSRAARERLDEASSGFERGLQAAEEALGRSFQEAETALERGLGEAESALEDATSGIERGLRRGLEPLIADRDRLRDELARLRDDLARAREGPLTEAHEALIDALESLRRGRKATREAQGRLRWRRFLLPSGIFAGLLEGYDMAIRRLERSLERLGLTEILCEGQAFDATRMRAVETEVRQDVPGGTVLDVVRPGFTRGDRVVRYAEVRTAAGAEGGDR